jgi:hypothetical protein
MRINIKSGQVNRAVKDYKKNKSYHCFYVFNDKKIHEENHTRVLLQLIVISSVVGVGIASLLTITGIPFILVQQTWAQGQPATTTTAYTCIF